MRGYEVYTTSEYCLGVRTLESPPGTWLMPQLTRSSEASLLGCDLSDIVKLLLEPGCSRGAWVCPLGTESSLLSCVTTVLGLLTKPSLAGALDPASRPRALMVSRLVSRILTLSLSRLYRVLGRIFFASLRLFLSFITIISDRMVRTRNVITAMTATWVEIKCFKWIDSYRVPLLLQDFELVSFFIQDDVL